MWRRRGEATVTCIACGETLDRSDAREYDKHGDRWDRREKEFEYLCKPCHGELCHQPRRGLESVLLEVGDAPSTEARFVERYYETVRETEKGEDDGRERER